MLNNKYLLIAIGLLVLAGGFVIVANATHSWGDYHWGRTTNPFTLELGDNTLPKWGVYLAGAASDWSISSVLDTIASPGNTSPERCRGTNGRVEVCSKNYGKNGWLGLAQIGVSPKTGHILKGIARMNDYYFDQPQYDTPELKTAVMCQEVGHTLGLLHQDENFTNPDLGTCMDYGSALANQHPNKHDYDMLELIYAHLDSVSTVGSTSYPSKSQAIERNIDLSDFREWGKPIRKDARGKNSLYERNFGNDEKLFTFVIWI